MWFINKIQAAEIKRLEAHVESLIGMNSILERELLKSQTTVKELQGIRTERPAEVQTLIAHQRPIDLKKKTSWPVVQAELEAKALREYWEKQSVKEDKSIDELEKELLKEEKKDV